MGGASRSQNGNRWVRVDRRYNRPYRLTTYAWRVILKWGALLIVWAACLSSGNAFLDVLATVAIVAYGVVRVRRYRQPSQIGTAQARTMAMPAVPAAVPMTFNAPPGWPPAPVGWTPPLGWQPDAGWPPVPAGWLLCGYHNRLKGADEIPV